MENMTFSHGKTFQKANLFVSVECKVEDTFSVVEIMFFALLGSF